MRRHREGPGEHGAPGADGVGVPGKRTRTGSLPAGGTSRPSPAPAGDGASSWAGASHHDDPFGLHLLDSSSAGGTTGGGPPASAPTSSDQQISAEPRIRALLQERIGASERQRLATRKTALLRIFAAIPELERDLLLRRLADPADDLGQLLAGELSPALRRQLLAVLRGESAPAPEMVDPDTAAFAATLGRERFGTSERVVSVDGHWSGSRSVDVFVRSGAAPPDGEIGPRLDWRLVDRTGAAVQNGAVSWAPGDPSCSPWSVELTEPGQWQVAIEVVHDGLVIATTELPILVRVAEAEGADLVASIRGSDPRVAAGSMSNAQLVEQTDAIRDQLGAYALGRKSPGDERDVRALRSALQELEWQGSQRQVDGKPVVPSDDPGALTVADAKVGSGADAASRALIQRRIDALIARRGLVGAELAVAELERELADEGEGVIGGIVNEALGKRVAVPWLREELAARRDETSSFLERFEEAGRAITYGLLAESEARVRGELERYQLAEAQAGGGYAGQGLKAGGDAVELRDAVEHGKRIQAAHAAWMQADRARPRDGAGDEQADDARRVFEATREVALAKHPMLRPFLEGTTQQARVMPSGSVPGALDVGTHSPEQLGKFVGWELNQKLSDIDETRSNLGEGVLSIFGVPKVVALTRQEMRVAPGSMLDGAVNERVARADSAHGWTQGLVAAISFGLGLLLAVPTGGSSVPAAGVVAAGELTLLAADLYLLGKEFEERGVYRAAANTDTSSVDSILQEEPAAGPLIFGFLGFAGPVAGVGAVVRSGSDMAQAMARAREGVAAVRDLRAAASAASGDLARPAVVHRIERLREVARDAGMTDAEIDALVRNVARGAGATRAAAASTVALESAAEVTDEMLPELARQLGVARVTRGGSGGAVAVQPTMASGRVVVEEVVVGPTARVADVLAHAETIQRLGRYDGLLGRIRATWDELRGLVGRGRPSRSPRNPHAPFSQGHEAFEEVHKYEGFIRTRMTELAAQLARGGADGAAAAARIEDEIRLMEGELAHWRDVLADVRRTGHVGDARGLIEVRDISAVTEEAIAAGYPRPPSDDYFYRRWPGGGPEGQEFQLLRRGADDADLSDVQVQKGASGWELRSIESPLPVASADPLEQQLRARISTLGASATAGDDLIEISKQLHVPVSVVFKIHDDSLRAAASSDVIHELKATLKLQDAGRIEGLGGWFADALPKLKQHPSSHLAELRDARRLTMEHPDRLIAIGRDAAVHAPVDAKTGAKLRTFDNEVRSANGSVERSIEVHAVGDVLNVSDLRAGVTHATGKAASRAASGNPVAGELEAAIAMKLVTKGPDRKSGKVTHDALGNRQLHTRDGQVLEHGNFYDTVAKHLSAYDFDGRLSRVTLVDLDDGAVLAQYDREGPVWNRIR